MASWNDVRKAALALPETVEDTSRGLRRWRVRDKPLAWERPLRASDRKALGDLAPSGDIIAFRTPDLIAREEHLAADPDVFFTTPHFDGYPAVLARLEPLRVEVLEHVMEEAWLCRAPKRMIKAYLATRRDQD